MIPKQRVLTAFARREPDRVPINYLCNPGIDRRLKEHFGLAPDDDEGLRLKLGVDFRGANAPYVGPPLHGKPDAPDKRIDPEWGRVTQWIEHESGGYFDYVDFPLRDADLQTVADWPMPAPDDYDYDRVRLQSRRFGDFAVFVGGAGTGDVINFTSMLRGMEQVLVDLMTDDPAGMLLIDRRLDVQLATLRRMLEAGDGAIDFVWLGEDLGTQIGPMISLETFRKHLRPRHQRFVDLAKEFGLPVMMHSCGSSSWAFDDFIDMGINVVDTLQPEARDMAPAYLKQHYGKRLAFHGCISTAGPVATGSVDETIDYVRQTLDIMMPGGGYCLSPTHQLQDNSLTENVLAMYDTALHHGRY